MRAGPWGQAAAAHRRPGRSALDSAGERFTVASMMTAVSAVSVMPLFYANAGGAQRG